MEPIWAIAANLCSFGQCHLGLGADAFDHRAQAVRALRCEILPQANAVKQRQGIDRQNVSRAFARVERKKSRDQTAYNVCVAVALERESWARSSVWLYICEKPNLAGATLNLVRIDVSFARQRRQSAAELDNVTVSIVPFIEQPEIFNNLFNRRHDASYISSWTAKAKVPATGRERKPLVISVYAAGRPSRISRRGGRGTGACQAGAKSAGVKVPCTGPAFSPEAAFSRSLVMNS